MSCPQALHRLESTICFISVSNYLCYRCLGTHHANIVTIKQNLGELFLVSGVVTVVGFVREMCLTTVALLSWDIQLCHVFQDHVYRSVSTMKQRFHLRKCILTNVIVESEKSTGKFYKRLSARKPLWAWSRFSLRIPLSPFITTQILEPTHLSINSWLMSLVTMNNHRIDASHKAVSYRGVTVAKPLYVKCL